MTNRRFFFTWIRVFASLGIAVPMLLLVHHALFPLRGWGAEFILWPSSIMFMGLDTPTPAKISTVIVVYAIAIAENADNVG